MIVSSVIMCTSDVLWTLQQNSIRRYGIKAEVYRNSQTTSTKCQYHAAASNPKWWFDEKCNVIWRRRHVVRKVVPIITCSPWNPAEAGSTTVHTTKYESK